MSDTRKVTDAEFDALSAQVADHETRITALEASAPPIEPPIEPPVPIDGDPSPDGAEATEPGVVLISALGNSYELCELARAADNYGIEYNGALDAATHHVSRLYADGGIVYQCANNYWYESHDDGSWSSTSDPTTPDVGPIDPPITPQPGDGSRLVSVYTKTRDAQGMWNFGTGNDAALAAALQGFAQDVGYTPNSYGFFPLWGSMFDWPGNLGWAVKCMNDQEFTRGWTPNVGLKAFWNGVPPAYYAWNDLQGHKDTASGVYDEVWRGCVRAVKDAGSNKAIWRLGYEDNFSFMCSFCGWDAEMQSWWVKSFERMSDCIMDETAKVGGFQSIIAFNPSLGRGSAPVENIIPNPSKFHWFAYDFYNGVYPDEPSDWETNEQTRKDFWLDMYYGLNHHIEYARQLGKPIAALETGAGQRPDGHGLDESAFFWDVQSEGAENARAVGVPWLGAMFWDVPAGDINALFSNNEQAPCQAAVKAHLADGTLIGDPQGTPSIAGAQKVTPVPYNKGAQRAWIEGNPDFVAMMRKRIEDVVERARARRDSK